jgi:hypothetical protein
MKSYLIATIWSFLLVTGIQGRKQKPLGKISNGEWDLPECEVCTPREIVEAPGIGFDLNIGYT